MFVVPTMGTGTVSPHETGEDNSYESFVATGGTQRQRSMSIGTAAEAAHRHFEMHEAELAAKHKKMP